MHQGTGLAGLQRYVMGQGFLGLPQIEKIQAGSVGLPRMDIDPWQIVGKGLTDLAWLH